MDHFAGQDRRLAKESRSEDGEIRKLRRAVTATPVLGKIGLEVSKKMGRKARTAAMTVQSVTVHLQPPERRTDPPQQLDSIAINAVLIREIEPPPGEEAIEWLLLTNLPVDTFAQAVTVAEYYACRWQVEIFFKVLKSGCRVEKLQLETEDRLKPCLMLYMIVAWRILFVTMLGRECPELPCDVVFAEEEWKSVWAIVKRRPTPCSRLRWREFLKIVAGLGGHLGRKGDGPPGPQTMWIGLQRTIDFAMAWMAFGPGCGRVKCTVADVAFARFVPCLRTLRIRSLAALRRSGLWLPLSFRHRASLPDANPSILQRRLAGTHFTHTNR